MTTRTELSEIAAGKNGHSDLMRAALDGDTTAALKLLAGGADVNAKDNEGRTALMFALINAHNNTVKELIEHGADVNAADNDGETALMMAATTGDMESVRTLLNKGADLSARNFRSGATALGLARQRGYDDIAALLEEARAQG
jgi:uncharacterized protein